MIWKVKNVERLFQVTGVGLVMQEAGGVQTNHVFWTRPPIICGPGATSVCMAGRERNQWGLWESWYWPRVVDADWRDDCGSRWDSGPRDIWQVTVRPPDWTSTTSREIFKISWLITILFLEDLPPHGCHFCMMLTPFGCGWKIGNNSSYKSRG